MKDRNIKVAVPISHKDCFSTIEPTIKIIASKEQITPKNIFIILIIYLPRGITSRHFERPQQALKFLLGLIRSQYRHRGGKQDFQHLILA